MRGFFSGRGTSSRPWAVVVFIALATSGLWLAQMPPAIAQSDALKQAFSSYRALAKDGDLEAGLARARKTLAMAREEFGPDHKNIGLILNDMGRMQADLGRPEAAIPLFEQALTVRETALGPDHSLVASTLAALADSLRAAGRDDAAVPHLTRAIAIREARDGPDHPRTAILLSALGRLHLAAGRYAAAEIPLQRALAIDRASRKADDPELAFGLNDLARLRVAQGRFAEAEPLLQEALAVQEAAHGPGHPGYATLLTGLADLKQQQGALDEAQALAARALGLREEALGKDHPAVATSLNQLANLARVQGRFDDAAELLTRDIAITEAALGPDHRDLAASLTDLALVREAQGQFDAAEPLHRRALEIRQTALGADHPQVALSQAALAGLYRQTGDYSQARRLFEDALALQRATLGPDHPQLAATANSFAHLQEALGRYEDSEELYRRALSIRETALGPDHPHVGFTLNDLANLLRADGRFGEAEPMLKRSIAVLETALGPNHPDVALPVGNLALLYRVQGRYRDAEPLYRRSLAIKEVALGPDHADFARELNNLGNLFRDLKAFGEAERIYRQALAVRERALGADHPHVAFNLNDLARVYRETGRLAEAETLLTRAAAIWEANGGLPHPDTAFTYAFLGLVKQSQQAFDEAAAAFRKAIDIRAAVVGSDHPDVADTIGQLAALEVERGQLDAALSQYRRATAIYLRRLQRGAGTDDPGLRAEQRRVRELFLQHVGALHRLAVQRPAEAYRYRTEAFEVAQLSRAAAAAASIARMAARFAAGDDALADLVREREQLNDRRNRLDAKLLAGISLPADLRDPVLEATYRRDLDAIAAQLTEIDARLARVFPQYAALTAPDPLTLAEVQRLLGGTEALVAMALGETWSYVFAVRRDSLSMAQVPITAGAVDDAVRALRDGLDPSRIGSAEQLFDFRASDAAGLYDAIWRPVAPALAGAGLVFVVPDGAMQSLPVGVLLTDPPTGPYDDFDDFRTAPWLARRHGLSVLPSVASLRALRVFVGRSPADRAFLGIGDPLLHDHPQLPAGSGGPWGVGTERPALRTATLEDSGVASVADDAFVFEDQVRMETTRAPRDDGVATLAEDAFVFDSAPAVAEVDAGAFVFETPGTDATIAETETGSALTDRTRSIAPLRWVAEQQSRSAELSSMFSGSLADVRAVASLDALPETADELAVMARSLGADSARLQLREQATETAVKALQDADRYRVLAFATHGLLAGEIRGAAEPALVMTPPAEAGPDDDGLLTASEIARLKLNADWVILSACNTAGPGGDPEAEGLSGLAKAFFHAGSRALFVSHWPVVSDATVELTTRMLHEVSDNGAERAEAHRQAILGLIERSPEPAYAHPLFWAPFVVVGEGGRGKPG